MAVNARDFDTIASKMPGDLGRAVRAAAKAAKVTPSRWLADAARLRLGEQPPEPAPKSGRRASGGRAKAAAPSEPSACTHPAGKRKRFAWGSMCDECGARVS